jgi:hypothetical protein
MTDGGKEKGCKSEIVSKQRWQLQKEGIGIRLERGRRGGEGGRKEDGRKEDGGGREDTE